LNDLLQKKTHDLTYRKTFLLTYQSFTTPEKLLHKLIQRYHVPKIVGITEIEFEKTIRKPIQLRVINVLKNWVELHYNDFNEKLISSLNFFVDNTLSRDGHLNLAKQLRNVMSRMDKATGEETYKTSGYTINPPEPKVPKNIFSPTLQLRDIEEEEIARQLTIIDFNLYSSIQASELLKMAWANPKHRHKAPGVVAIMQRFDNVALWVSYTILMSFADKKQKSKMMTKFIKIAEHLRALNNFNTLMAILNGVNHPSVKQLKKHISDELDRNYLKSLSELTKLVPNDKASDKVNDKANKPYQEALYTAEPPCTPYLGFYLQSLSDIEEQNPDNIQGLINFDKRSLVAKVIKEIQTYQQSPYNLQPVHQIAAFLNKFETRTEEELTQLSSQILSGKPVPGVAN